VRAVVLCRRARRRATRKRPPGGRPESARRGEDSIRHTPLKKAVLFTHAFVAARCHGASLAESRRAAAYEAAARAGAHANQVQVEAQRRCHGSPPGVRTRRICDRRCPRSTDGRRSGGEAWRATDVQNMLRSEQSPATAVRPRACIRRIQKAAGQCAA